MTREEELDWLCRLRSEIYVYMPREWLIPMNDALDMAIKALEQERSRSAEITQYRHDCEKLMEENERLKKALEQEPKTEKVIKMRDATPEERESIDKYIKSISKPTRPTEWTPVSERMPEKEGTYLLWGKLADDEDYYCFIGDYDEGCEQFGYWEQQYDINTLGCLGEEFFEYECVIAWMPLPQPYTEMREGEYN